MGNRKVKINLATVMQNERKSNNLTIDKIIELHDKFMEDKTLEGLRVRTLKDYKEHFKYFIKYVHSAYRSNSDRIAIDTDIFKNYVSYMVVEKQYSPFTVNIRLRTLKAFLKWLFENNYTENNYALKLKTMKVPQDTVQTLSDAEIKKLLNTCDLTTYAGLRDFTLIITILDCGIRLGEIAELKKNDVDLKHRLINVRGEVSKTRTFRQLPISLKTCKLLKELIYISNEMKSEYVFQSTYGGKIKKQNLSLSLARLGKKAKINKRCTGYVFRHVFATNAVKAGMDLFTLQRYMGHTVTQTTRRYVQLDTTDLQKSHDKYSNIDKFLK